MYAVFEKGKIKEYIALPKSYHSEVANVLGGFDKLPNEELKKHGFYPIEKANITDPLFEKKGSIYFDEANKVFRYKIEKFNHSSVETLRKEKLRDLEEDKKRHLEKTNFKVLECLELDEPIPTEIKEERSLIRSEYTKISKKLNSLETQRDLLTFTESITTT